MTIPYLFTCSSESLTDHDYLNYDPGNPQFHLGLGMQDKDVEQPPVAQTLTEPSSAASQAASSLQQPSSSKTSQADLKDPDYENFDPSAASLVQDLVRSEVAADNNSSPQLTENSQEIGVKPALVEPGSQQKWPSLQTSQEIDVKAAPLVLPKPGSQQKQPTTPVCLSNALDSPHMHRGGKAPPPPPPVRKSSVKDNFGVVPNMQGEVATPPPTAVVETMTVAAAADEEGKQKSVSRNPSIKEKALLLEKKMKGDKTVIKETERESDKEETHRDSGSGPGSPAMNSLTRKPIQKAPPIVMSAELSPVLSPDHSGQFQPQLAKQMRSQTFAVRPQTRGSASSSTSSSNSSSPTLTPSHSQVSSERLDQSVVPRLETALGSRAATMSEQSPRPGLSKIRQKIAWKKDSPGDNVGRGDGESRRIDTIRRNLEQKKSIANPPTATARRSSPATLPRSFGTRCGLQEPATTTTTITTSNSTSEDLAPPSSSVPTIPPLPPKSPVLGEQSVSGGESPPPPIPARTPEMYLKPIPKTAKLPRNYLNVSLTSPGTAATAAVSLTGESPGIAATAATTTTTSGREEKMKKTLKPSATVKSKKEQKLDQSESEGKMRRLFTKKNTEKQGSTSPKNSNENSPKKRGKKSPKKKPFITRAKFLNMSIRPLPALPGRHRDADALPDHTEDDYEQFGVLDTMDDMYVNYPRLPLSSSGRNPPQPLGDGGAAVRRWSSFGAKDTHGIDNRPPIQIPDVPDYIEGYVNTDGLPFATSVQQTVDADNLPPRRLPPPDEPEDDVDYDYPDLRGAGMFRSVPATQRLMRKLEERIRNDKVDTNMLYNGVRERFTALRNENQDVGLLRTVSNASSDYVSMDGLVKDDSYVTYDSSQQGKTTGLPPRHQLRSGSLPPASLHEGGMVEQPFVPLPSEEEEEEEQCADEDITVYMNLPMPEKVVAPPPRHSTLPQVKAAVSPSHSGPPPVAVKPKPKITRASSDDSKSVTKSPKPQPKPRSATVLAATQISEFHEGASPSPGWKSPQNSSQSPPELEYENFDVAQSLPAKSGVSTKSILENRRVSADSALSKLPPRDILRQPEK